MIRTSRRRLSLALSAIGVLAGAALPSGGSTHERTGGWTLEKCEAKQANAYEQYVESRKRLTGTVVDVGLSAVADWQKFE